MCKLPSPCLPVSVHRQHDLAAGAPLDHAVIGTGVILKRIDISDNRLQLTRLKHGPELLDIPQILLRLLTGKAPPEDPHDGAALEQCQVEWNARDGAAGKADDQVAASPGHTANRRFGKVTADRVVDHIDALAISQRLYGVL